MSVSNIGSFLQSASVSWASSQGSAIDALGSAISQAEANKSKGLAAIANGEALTRTNNQISQLIQNLLDGTNGTSSSAKTSTSTSAKPAKPATGTGTKSVLISTPLSTLGFLKGGSIYISAGGNTTTYTSTGSDTVGDLLSAINSQLPTNAQVSAKLNGSGDIVFTSRNTKDQVVVSGVFASNLGFSVGNQTFKPTPAVNPTSSASSSSSSGSKKTTSTPPKPNTSLQTALSTNAGSAASVLAASGAAGSLVNMLA